MKFIQKTDPELYQLIQKEEQRQQETLMMIPSENIASKAVEDAVGSCLGNKYAEGYPFKRYYQGQQFVDLIEQTTIDRAKALFKVPFANVQPHSGSPANFAVYTALLNPGDTIMGLNLSSGGHLTHGANMSSSSKYFRSVPYDVTPDGLIDYDGLAVLAQKEKPRIIIAGGSAYARINDWKRFAEIADSVGAFLMADIAHFAGLVAAGEYPSPVEYAHILTTTTHKTLRGPRGAMIMVTEKGLAKDSELGEKINKAIIPGIQGGPHLNSIAGIGVALLEASKQSFKEYSHQVLVNAKVLAEDLMNFGFNLVTGGTETHLLLIDLRNKDLLGNTVAEACDVAGIVLNRNGVPYDPNPPFYPSGIRLGTPGLTSRNMKEQQMKQIAKWIHEIVEEVQKTKKQLGFTIAEEKKKDNRKQIIEQTIALKRINDEVKALCAEFPIIETY